MTVNTFFGVILDVIKICLKNLDYEGVEFLVSKKDCCKIEQKNNICINVFCYENELSYPVYVSREI